MSHSKSTRRDFLERTWQLTLGANFGLVGMSQVGCTREMAPEPTEPVPKEPLATEWLGGRKVTPEKLRQIHNRPYMLHVKGGELNKVPVQKNLLLHDAEGHVQGIVVAQAPEGAIYVKQRTLGVSPRMEEKVGQGIPARKRWNRVSAFSVSSVMAASWAYQIRPQVSGRMGW